MATQRHLGRPPITEALVDIRFAGDGPDAAMLEPLRDQLRQQYPKVEEQRGIETRFTVATKGRLESSSKDLGFHGLFFKREDDRAVAQFRRDGFTYNQLAPYRDADGLFREALELWISRGIVPSITRNKIERLEAVVQILEDLRRE